MRRYDEARWLFQQYVTELATAQPSHDGKLHAMCESSSGGDMLTREAWIIFNLRDSNASELAKVRAFIEIVSQLSASVDFQWREFYHSFWKHALMKPLACTICSDRIVGRHPEPTELDEFEQLMESEGPRFELNFDEVSHGRLQLDMLRDLLLMDPRQALGEKHSAVLSRLTTWNLPTAVKEAMDTKNPSQTTRVSSKKARIELCLTLSTRSLSTSEFRTLAQLLEDIVEHGQGEQSAKDNAVRYEITTLGFPPGDKTLEHMELKILEEMIASETSTIRHLRIESAAAMLLCHQDLHMFEQLLRTTVCTSLTDTKPTLETLQLYDDLFEHSHVESICSALRYANSLKRLHLEWTVPCYHDRERTQRIWAWLAFGIFHPDSEAKLNRLALSNSPLQAEDTATFASIIRSAHPGKKLWTLEHGGLPEGKGLEEVALPAGQRVFVQLKTKTKLRVAPKVKAPTLGFLASPSEEFEVAIDLTTWVCLVVRGCGFAWVPSASIVSRREMVSKCEPVPEATNGEAELSVVPIGGANVKVLDRYALTEEMRSEDYASDDERDPIDDWRCGPDPIEQLNLLLQMVGHGLEGLNYASIYEMAISDSDLSQMLESCPNLTHLNLIGTTVASLAPVRDRYESQTCHLSSLSVYADEGNAHLLSQVAGLLENPFSTPLKYVEVNGSVISSDCMGKMESALKCNQSLQTIFFNSTNHWDAQDLVRMQKDFEAAPPRSRLSLNSKIAFLSAIEAHSKRESITKAGSSSSSNSSMGKLDSSIVSQVFAFAGVPLSRTMIW